MSNMVNNDEDALTKTMKRMTLSTAAGTALPSSSPTTPSEKKTPDIKGYNAGSSPVRPSATPLRRVPSASSLGANERASPTALYRKTSLSSLRGSGSSTPPRSPAPRRSSSYFHNLSMGDRSSLPPPVEEAPKPPLTAASVARTFFEKELEVKHGGSETTREARTVVIVQDACYGHRYSRPRTSKSSLSTIVERPERIHASLLGVATAYVRLGGRHADGDAAPHPNRDPISLPPAPFKIHKTSRTLSLRSPAATAVHGTKWMEELVTMCERAESKLAVNGKELTRINSSDLNDGNDASEKQTFHEGDLYLCSGSLNALEGALGGVCAGIDAVFEEKGARRSFVCVRPPGHHCAADMPSGFCWLNNVHVGIQHAISSHGLTHAAIIDFDLHHGDGSQSITWAHNSRVLSMPKNTLISKKVSIGYFSLHDINSYPCEEGDDEKVRSASLCIENAHGQSIWNVHLQPWKTIAEFWALYEDRYMAILAKARAFLQAHSDRLRQAPTHPKPKGAIFLSAGFDASEWESAGMQRHQVNVPTEFYARFTRDVITMAEEESLGVDGRVISVLEGGYSDRALMSGVLSHISGMVGTTDANEFPHINNGSVNGLHEGKGLMDVDKVPIKGPGKPEFQKTYNSNWWSVRALEEIENLVNPPSHPGASKTQRSKVQPTFTTPTESSIAKVVPGHAGRRSMSGSSATGGAPINFIPRGPSPPPPDVGWAIAAQELSGLLIPSDRETKSCKPEDLNAEATRKRRDRQSNIGLPTETRTVSSEQMPIRETRNKAAKPMPDLEEGRKLPPRASRRKTVADVSLLNEELNSTTAASDPRSVPQPKAPRRRRSSVASSVTSMSTLATDKGSEFSLPSIMDNSVQRESLAVKKTRAPAAPRQEAAKPKQVKKPAPIARQPSTGSTMPNGQNVQSVESATKAPLSVNQDVKNKDVDQLTAGMKTMSIKLHVPPKEEYEARQQKAKPAPRGRPSKSTAPKVSKPRSPTKPKGRIGSHASPQSASGDATKRSGEGTVAELAIRSSSPPPLPSSASAQDKELPHQVEQSMQPSARESSNTTPAIPNSEMKPAHPLPLVPLFPTQPNPTESANVAIPQDTLSQSTPKKPGTPTTVRRATKQDLPVFTSTSPIPFGRSKASMEQTMMFQPQPDPGIQTKSPQIPNLQPSQTRVPIPAQSQVTQEVESENALTSSPSDIFNPPPSPLSPSKQEPQNQLSQPAESTGSLNQPLLPGEHTDLHSIWDIPGTPQPPPQHRKIQ